MKALYLLSFLFLVETSSAQSFNEISFKNAKGDSVMLSHLAGKKILFAVVPLSPTDSTFNQLQNFQNKYKDSIQIVGVLSFEDGYKSVNAATIQAMYRNSGIILTEGMYTKKTSGSNQSPLMRWLTDKNKNGHFDMDARGVGQKFFITAKGRLYAVMPPQVAFTNPIIDKIVLSSTQ